MSVRSVVNSVQEMFSSSEKENEEKVGEDTPPSIHPKFQRLTCRCISCEKQVLSNASRSRRQCDTVSWVDRVTFSGGKLSCGDCDVNHNDYCLHGALLTDSCPYCPEDNRQRTLNDYPE